MAENIATIFVNRLSEPTRPRTERHRRGHSFVVSLLQQNLAHNCHFTSTPKDTKVTYMSDLMVMSEVETSHLVLREIERADADELAAFMTQPRYQRHIAHRLRDGTMVADFVRRQVAARADRRRHIFHLAAEEKMSGDVVGEGFAINHGNGSFEIGWGVHPAMWAMGLGTEIGTALIGVCFERLKATDAWCKVMDGNMASAKLARRIGMKHMTSHMDHPTTPGQRGPVHVFSMTAGDYFDLPY